MGASKNSNLMEWDKLWNFNKNVIDPTAHRYTALLTDGLVPLQLAGAPAHPNPNPNPDPNPNPNPNPDPNTNPHPNPNPNPNP